jgi:hypothetical protein
MIKVTLPSSLRHADVDFRNDLPHYLDGFPVNFAGRLTQQDGGDVSIYLKIVWEVWQDIIRLVTTTRALHRWMNITQPNTVASHVTGALCVTAWYAVTRPTYTLQGAFFTFTIISVEIVYSEKTTGRLILCQEKLLISYGNQLLFGDWSCDCSSECFVRRFIEVTKNFAPDKRYCFCFKGLWFNGNLVWVTN